MAFVAIGAVFFIRTFLVQPFLVSGGSMSPNFSDGDYLLVDQLTYRFREPGRGEVAVFHSPNDESVYFIKRIIGLPGETIEIENGKIVVKNPENPDGLVLTELYLPQGESTNSVSEITLNKGEYFVLGDNRLHSFDSRSWGSLGAEEIVGLVRLRLWPPKSVTVFAAPEFSR